MRNRFDEQLDYLNRELIEMGSLCEKAISSAIKALSENDSELAKMVVALDDEIDQKERDIESLCLKLILQQQPVARDLRQISAALKMIRDMERIGDQAQDISEIIPVINLYNMSNNEHVEKMEKAAKKMVTDSVQAYVEKNTVLAESVIKYDDVVDDCFNEVKNDIISMIAENPKNGEYALDLLMIVKYLERIGDHAVNIAEEVLFSING